MGSKEKVKQFLVIDLVVVYPKRDYYAHHNWVANTLSCQAKYIFCQKYDILGEGAGVLTA